MIMPNLANSTATIALTPYYLVAIYIYIFIYWLSVYTGDPIALEAGVWADSQAQASLKPKAKSLDIRTISHKLLKVCRVGSRVVPKVREAARGGDISANGPSSHILLKLLAEEEVVQQLGSLWVRSVFQNTSALRPSDVLALGDLREVERSRRPEATTCSEEGGFRLVGGRGNLSGCRRAANPSRVLGQELVKPRFAVLL